MIISQFHKSYSQQIFWIVVMGFVLMGGQLFVACPFVFDQDSSSVLYQLFPNPDGSFVFVYKIITVLLLFLQAFVVADISGRNYLMGRTNLLPALIYMVLMSFRFKDCMMLQPIIWNTFIIAYVWIVLSLKSDREDLERVLNGSMVLALGSFFNHKLVVFLLFGWMVLWGLRVFRWREWVITVFGFGIPYFFYGVFLFLTDRFVNFSTFFMLPESFVPDFSLKDASLSVLAYLPIYALLSTFALTVFLIGMREKTVKTRRVSVLMLHFLVVSAIYFVFSGVNVLDVIMIINIPLSVAIAWWLEEMKRLWLKELLLTVLVVFVIISNLL